MKKLSFLLMLFMLVFSTVLCPGKKSGDAAEEGAAPGAEDSGTEAGEEQNSGQ